jgi:hypothetical protein
MAGDRLVERPPRSAGGRCRGQRAVNRLPRDARPGCFTERYLDTYTTVRPEALADLPMWLSTIGRLLLAREPDTAFADELTERWIDPGTTRVASDET